MEMSTSAICGGGPDAFLLCAGGAVLALGAAFVHTHNHAPEPLAENRFRRLALLMAALLSFAFGAALIVRGW